MRRDKKEKLNRRKFYKIKETEQTLQKSEEKIQATVHLLASDQILCNTMGCTKFETF